MAKKRAKVTAGMSRNVAGSADQMDEPMRHQVPLAGTAATTGPVPSRSADESPGWRSARPLETSARATRLKRTDVGQHAQERRSDQVAPLGEHGGERGAPPLDPGDLVRHAEAHVARLGGHAQRVEEPDQTGVVALVVDEEPGVDVERSVGQIHGDGVGMSPRSAVGLEHGHVVATREEVGADQAGDAACRRWRSSSVRQLLARSSVSDCSLFGAAARSG